MTRAQKWCTLILAGIAFCIVLIWQDQPSEGATFRTVTSGCVDRPESNGMHQRFSRHELEKRWEVKGLGVDMEVAGFGDVVAYPRCGYEFDPFNPKNAEAGWIGAMYNASGRITCVVWYSNRQTAESAS